jgi:type VI secretion system secreted protein Hcp
LAERAMPPLPNGDTDMFLRVRCARAGDVKGESVAKGHTDDIVLSSWHWGLAASSAIGSTRATARRSFKHLTVVKMIDSSSTALMSALATNDEVREAKLSMRKAGESQMDFFTITLGSARVSAIDLDIDESGNPVERVSFAFAKVEVEYRRQQASGQRGASTTFVDELLAEE